MLREFTAFYSANEMVDGQGQSSVPEFKLRIFMRFFSSKVAVALRKSAKESFRNCRICALVLMESEPFSCSPTSATASLPAKHS
jgi:hypothetical protein